MPKKRRGIQCVGVREERKEESYYEKWTSKKFKQGWEITHLALYAACLQALISIPSTSWLEEPLWMWPSGPPALLA